MRLYETAQDRQHTAESAALALVRVQPCATGVGTNCACHPAARHGSGYRGRWSALDNGATRARSRVRAYNQYERKFGLNPSLPGACLACGAMKAGAMRVFIPARKVVVKLLEKPQEQFGKLRRK
jgi:hypothetical protein